MEIVIGLSVSLQFKSMYCISIFQVVQRVVTEITYGWVHIHFMSSDLIIRR